jgi:radical SAM-linked protein
MAYSAGFHPHPKVSYANAAPTGTASEAEYFEISVTDRVDPESVRVALDDALPEGLDVLEVVEAGPGSLADRLQASDWRMEFRGVTQEQLQAAAESLLARDRAEVTRMFKTGPKTFDVRSALVSVSSAASAEEGCAILRVVVRHTTPAVRPDDVLTALRAVTELAPPVPPLVTRLAQGPLETATAGVADPLAADKGAAGT